MTLIFANAGVPMLFLQLPAMLWALLPVILIEILVAQAMLKLSFAKAGKALVTANLATTLVGFPLVWILLVGMELALGGGRAYGLMTFWTRAYAVTVQAPWLIPYEDDLHWMIPVAATYLLIPAFFASVFIERWICTAFWPEQEENQIRRFSWHAHLWSYIALILVSGVYYGTIIKQG